MRKFNTHQTMAGYANREQYLVTVREGGPGKIIGVFDIHTPKYTANQLTLIENINSALRKENKAEMTNEEIEYMFSDSASFKEPSEDELQKLAGFTVEKIVKPTPTASKPVTQLAGTLPRMVNEI